MKSNTDAIEEIRNICCPDDVPEWYAGEFRKIKNRIINALQNEFCIDLSNIDRNALNDEQLYLAESICFLLGREQQDKTLSDTTINALLKIRQKLVCHFSPIGGYKCYKIIRGKMSTPEGVYNLSVDTCLRTEIYKLRKDHNVNTVGCCCGHGIEEPYIQVDDSSVEKMYKLGYVERPVDDNGLGQNCFTPKTPLLHPRENNIRLYGLKSDIRKLQTYERFQGDNELFISLEDVLNLLEKHLVTAYWYDVGSLSCRCSKCGCKNNRESRFCPNCGARMEVKNE